jgi:ribosome maturation factor RimP
MFEPTVTALGFELLAVLFIKSQQSSVLRLYIDREGGIGVDHCASVSHQISGILEVESPFDGEYTLEVSSPGVDRPLFKVAHFERFIGQRAKVWLAQKVEGRVKVAGKIQKTENNNIYIMDDEDHVYCMSIDNIDKAKLVPVY